MFDPSTPKHPHSRLTRRLAEPCEFPPKSRRLGQQTTIEETRGTSFWRSRNGIRFGIWTNSQSRPQSANARPMLRSLLGKTPRRPGALIGHEGRQLMGVSNAQSFTDRRCCCRNGVFDGQRGSATGGRFRATSSKSRGSSTLRPLGSASPVATSTSDDEQPRTPARTASFADPRGIRGGTNRRPAGTVGTPAAIVSGCRSEFRRRGQWLRRTSGCIFGQ